MFQNGAYDRNIPSGGISPFKSIVVGTRIRSRIDCLVVFLFRGNFFISKGGVFGKWMIL